MLAKQTFTKLTTATPVDYISKLIGSGHLLYRIRDGIIAAALFHCNDATNILQSTYGLRDNECIIRTTISYHTKCYSQNKSMV